MSAQSSPTPSTAPARKAITLPRLREMHAAGEKITMLTAYDASFARVADDAGLDCLLIGDSLGMVLQGYSSTLPVTMADMLYHTRCVAAGSRSALIVGDLPYGSYHEGVEQAYRNACELMQAGAHMVKLEGGGWTVPVVEYLTTRSIPVCAHLGLTPQSVHAIGGYRIQGKDDAGAAKLKADALALEAAGASLCVLELMPSAAANAVTAACKHMATIGIGAGNGTAGQVLVLHDMLGITSGRVPRFVKNFLAGQPSVAAALTAYVSEVKAGKFPDNVLHGY
jgi:3-methyl-2-oxobutanoate hydroxymethyltransferase